MRQQGSRAPHVDAARAVRLDESGRSEPRTPWRRHASRVLFIDDRVPHDRLGFGYPRARRFLEELTDDTRTLVTLYPLIVPADDEPSPLPASVEVIADRGESGLGSFLSERRGVYDVVIVSRPHNMSRFLAAIATSPGHVARAQIVYDAEAIAAARDAMRVDVTGSVPEVDDIEDRHQAELALGQHADTVLCVSAAEAEHFERYGHPDVRVLGHALAITPTPAGFSDRAGFLFVGAMPDDECPNADAVVWFVENVWPAIVAKLGSEATLDIVGVCGSPAVLRCADERIHIHRAVPDLTPFYSRARVQVVPTRFAAGIPMKAHQAAAHGLPMVVTTLIRDQLVWTDAVSAATTAVEFADASIRVYSDRELWERQRRAALEAVQTDCDERRFADTVRALIPYQVSRDTCDRRFARRSTARDTSTSWRSEIDRRLPRGRAER